jgi:hypothetical protein
MPRLAKGLLLATAIATEGTKGLKPDTVALQKEVLNAAALTD